MEITSSCEIFLFSYNWSEMGKYHISRGVLLQSAYYLLEVLLLGMLEVNTYQRVQ